MGPRRTPSRLWAVTLALAALPGPSARAQAPQPPAPAPAPTAEQLAERLRVLEGRNRDLAEQLERTAREQDERLRQLLDRFGAAPAPGAGAGTNGAATTPTGDVAPAAGRGTPVPDYTEGAFDPFLPAPDYPGTAAPASGRFPLKASFGPGFLLQTEDDRFRLQIHYESQIEGRVWGRGDQVPTNGGFFLPRQRIFFDGHVTKAVEYEFAINRGLNNINLLNAYLNFHLDDRFQVKVGRFFTPLPYDQYAISNYWLPTPERSLFTTNVGLNRQIGAMAWGYLFDKRVDYAVGAFNGSRNSFESLNNAVDVVGYLNARPFQQSAALPAAKFLNVGTSVAFGNQDQVPVPATFRVGAGSPDANIPSTATVPFLVLNPGVVERGDRLLGSVHAAYFYRGLSVIGEWQYGDARYATAGGPSVRVPLSGFYVTGGYFLTGEEVERRTRVKPLRPLLPTNKDDRRGCGALEAVARVSQLRLGGQVFDGGFADRALWSNEAVTTELGVNWYLNEYLKVYAFWLRADFGSPVQYRPGRSQKSADLFWLRCQLYF